MTNFSVIIPIYNIEKYIDECVKSVLAQSYENFEIILVNDGSTDKSTLICEHFSNQYENIITIHKSNGGLSSARNEGVKIAKGEYLIFIDGDDYIDSEALKNFARIIDENPGVDLVCGKFINHLPTDKLYYEEFSFPKINRNLVGSEALNLLFQEVPNIIWSACRTIYRRRFFTDNQFQFKEGITSEDLDLIPKVYMKANFVATNNTPFYYYRLGRENSIINTVTAKKFYDLVEIISGHVKMLKENNVNETFKKNFLMQLANIYVRYLVLVSTVPKKERRQVVEKLLDLDWLVKYSTGARGTFVPISIRIIGIELTSKLYNLLKKIMYTISR